MFQVSEDDRDAQCFIKAKRNGEPTFTLRAQDETAADVIAYWLTKNHQLSPDRKMEAVAAIKRFENWPKKRKAD